MCSCLATRASSACCSCWDSSASCRSKPWGGNSYNVDNRCKEIFFSWGKRRLPPPVFWLPLIPSIKIFHCNSSNVSHLASLLSFQAGFDVGIILLEELVIGHLHLGQFSPRWKKIIHTIAKGLRLIWLLLSEMPSFPLALPTSLSHSLFLGGTLSFHSQSTLKVLHLQPQLIHLYAVLFVADFSLLFKLLQSFTSPSNPVELAHRWSSNCLTCQNSSVAEFPSNLYPGKYTPRQH